ncbi:PREDICTED: uncharacterized protein LOC108576742 [Habropoda laboriosa]|uniref:uncharacterized protein LOC108576742 n=1 Tax=Habropoda laboriosa TaxID=597456 RepID=UPI00083D7CD6|nr:PREDICTED: uncharacterized protein LOC108576742 [Habropoda laboriosa]
MIYMIVFLKYVTIWVKNEAYNQGYEHMRIDWCKLKDVEEINTLNREYSNASKYNMLLFRKEIQYYSSIISPLTEINTNKLLVRTEYFVDYKDYIYLITIHATIAIMCSVTMQISSDILNNIFMMHISGMFEVIGLFKIFEVCMFSNGVAQILLGTICMTGVMLKVSRILRNIVDSKSFLELRLYVNFKMKRNQVSQVYLDQTDRRVIQEYLNWSDESVRGVCLTRVREIIECMMLQMISSNENFEYKFFVVLIAFVYLSIMYVNLSPAEKIIQSSEVLFFKTYCAKWYKAPVKSQKMLLFLMHRFMEPCRLKLKSLVAAVIHITQIFSFKMVQTGFSYFTVLYSLQE